MRALFVVSAVLLASCGHPLRRPALLNSMGQPCEQAVANVDQFALACESIYSEPERRRCLGAIAAASQLRRIRYCTSGQNPGDCSPAACATIGDYWFADDECVVAAFGPPPRSAMELLGPQ